MECRLTTKRRSSFGGWRSLLKSVHVSPASQRSTRYRSLPKSERFFRKIPFLSRQMTYACRSHSYIIYYTD